MRVELFFYPYILRFSDGSIPIWSTVPGRGKKTDGDVGPPKEQVGWKKGLFCSSNASIIISASQGLPVLSQKQSPAHIYCLD